MGKNELVSLSILFEGPKHAYAINALIKEFSLEEWTSTSKASIYNCLKRLNINGFVDVKQIKVGNMPDRKVYSITEKGKSELANQIRDAFEPENKNLEMFYIGFLFGLGIAGKEISDLLVRKKEKMAECIIEKQRIIKEVEQYNVTHVAIMLQCVIDKMNRIIEMIDEMISLLNNDPDYYLKNMAKWKHIFEKEG